MEHLLKSISGRTLSMEERKNLSIELAAKLQLAANKEQTRKERAQSIELARMIKDPEGKAFLTAMSDECFRSKNPNRIANQMLYLLEEYGLPHFLAPIKRLGLILFRLFGNTAPNFLVTLAKRFLRKETSHVIIPGEKRALSRHIRKRRREGVRLNINHLGEAILGEEEATRRLNIYLRDLSSPLIDYVSIKISTIYSQITLLAYEQTIDRIAKRLRALYRAAAPNKFVNLDMEEYNDLHLTKDLFMRVLSEKEFVNASAGIVLQAYLPDSFEILKELTTWAKKRSVPIKVRIVKGANMCMEKIEASHKNWPQAPYKTKLETDANYKRMVTYALQPENAKAVNIGIASHNLFDIAYALILRAEHGLDQEVTFEMLEGMSDHVRRVVQKVSGGMLLYCAVATKEDFQSSIAYLIRRLDENTVAENFLAHSFGLKPETPIWEAQAACFCNAIDKMKEVKTLPRKIQNRNLPPIHLDSSASFKNEADTDFSLPKNIAWAETITRKWQGKILPPLPKTPIEEALKKAKGGVSPLQIRNVAKALRERRADLIGMMMVDGNKVILEADVEISEAIDFCEYYIRSYERFTAMSDLEWSAKGTILVTPPWNFPVAIPVGGIIAALVTGNTVLFKPAPEAVQTGWLIANIMWDAGIPHEALVFINCDDEPTGSDLIKNPQVDAVILTGSNKTARKFLQLRPGLDLSAETGGKNSMVITALADRDLAIKELVNSAFSHAGQKCSATSIAILEAEVYDDPRFLQQLKDAAKSLHVGSPFDLETKVPPLIHEPNEDLLRALTTLEPGESWLLKPEQLEETLWTPGIKLGVTKGNYTHQTEFFGPVLGLIRTESLFGALRIANGTSYGLTAAIHTLDKREQNFWEKVILAGNCYINRGTTGAVVERQAFGGCKNSVYGHGSKAGGPNYLTQFMRPKQIGIPKEKHAIGFWVNNLTRILEKVELNANELGLWYASVSNYAFWWSRYKKGWDKSKLLGQDNHFGYRIHKKTIFRIDSNDSPLDYLRIFAAALSCETPLFISWDPSAKELAAHINWQAQFPIFTIRYETEEEFINRLCPEKIKRIRLVHAPSDSLKKAASENGCYLDHDPVMANGRIELLHYLREVSISKEYHRYGNLGLREHEQRKPIL